MIEKNRAYPVPGLLLGEQCATRDCPEVQS